MKNCIYTYAKLVQLYIEYIVGDYPTISPACGWTAPLVSIWAGTIS